MKAICERYGLPYNTGPFRKQFGSVQRTILRLAFPGGRPRPKPGPYRGGEGRVRTTAPDDRLVHRPPGASSGPQQPQDGVRVVVPPSAAATTTG